MNPKIIFSTVFLCGLISAASAQLPPGLPLAPENYALPHLWGSSSAINIEHLAMGSAYAGDDESDWHGNPAGVLSLEEPEVLAYGMRAGFEDLPDFESAFVGYAQPINEKIALKVSFATVRASGALTGTPLTAKIRENDVGVELGYRLRGKLWLGAAAAYLDAQSDYSLAGVGNVTRLESHPAKLGGRVGFLYQISDKFSLGGTLDRYSETVSESVPVLGAPPTTFRFDSKAYRIGVKWSPDANTKLLLDYDASQLQGASFQQNQRLWLAGAERRVGDFQFRVGSFDGKLTGGLGFSARGWKLDYGFSERSAKLLPGRGAHTPHAFQAIKSF